MPQDSFNDPRDPDRASGDVPGRGDRRSESRYQAVRWIGRLSNGRNSELCVIRNICSTGLVAQVFSRYAVGDRISVTLTDARLLEGAVVWASANTIELRFAEARELRAPAAASAAASAGATRREISCPGRLRLGNERHVVEVRDLSQGGVKLATPVLPELGEEALLEVEGLGELPGVVRWCENGHVGIAFLQPLPFDDLSGWIVAREQTTGDDDAEGVPQRRWPRYHMLLKSWMQLSGVTSPVEIYIHNLCRGGTMVSCAPGLHRGEHVVVNLGRAGEVPGSVVWTDAEHAGIAFDRTLQADHVRQPFASRSVTPILHHQADGRRPGLRIQ